jgi:predicted amidohydrolase YtcJ
MTTCKADLILFNGHVHTLDAALPFASAVAVRGDRILAVGGDADVLNLRGAATSVIDLRGRTVLPGFTDAHIHFTMWALRRQQIDLSEAATPEEALARVAGRVAQTPPGAWVLGGGFDRNVWPGAAWPTRQMLDAAAPQHPVMLSSKDGHSVWANTLALHLAGVTAETADPPGGRIVHDPATGGPAGILSESAAELIWRVVPPATLGQIVAAVR